MAYQISSTSLAFFHFDVPEFTFKKEGEITDGPFSLEVNVKVISQEHGVFVSELLVKLRKEKIDDKEFVEARIEIDGVFRGFFKVDESIPEEDLKNYLEISAPMILFPYVRSFISSFTSQAGINTILLPPVKITKKHE